MLLARTRRALLLAALTTAPLGCSPGGAVTPPPPVAPPPAPAAALPAPGAATDVPATPKKPVVDTYQGVAVTDDYRWLETWSDPAVQAWTAAQTARARKALDALPLAAPLQKQLGDLKRAQSPDHYALTPRKGVLFAMKWDPAKQQPALVTMTSEDAAAQAKVVLDPNVLNPKGTTAIDFYVPSFDGKLVAVSLSEGGSEDGTVHVYDAATGKEHTDVIPRVNGGTAGGSVVWNKAGTGFWYTRYPRGTERAAEDMSFYQQVYFHKLGTRTEDDTYAVGKEFPRIAEVELHTREDGKFVLATVLNGDGGEAGFWLLGPSGKWVEIAKFEDQVVHAELGDDGGVYLLSHKGAPRGKVLRVPADRPELAKAVTIVPEGAASIRAIAPTAKSLYVTGLLGGPSELRVYDLKGKERGLVPLLPVSSVGQVISAGGDDVLVRSQTFIDPPAWYRYAASTGKVTRSSLFTTSPATFADAEVVRETCKSKDGTDVPLNVIRKKGLVMDHTHPTLLNAYGGYGISLSPRFNEEMRVWLDHGGVWAIANLRGGGELGEAWHEAGKLTKKQNVFDDMAACARHLDEAGYTSPKKLALVGGSNGGLLMGAMLTQSPGLFGAVASYVGIYDMLRVETWPNGAFNVTEFGTVKDPAQFKALYAYSPYHHVTDGQAYPATLMQTGANDPRVDPSQSRKMTARMQAASPASTVLLLTNLDAGHGIGSSLEQEIQEATDRYAFLLHHLGEDASGK